MSYRGFTLIELLTVLGLISMLASVSIFMGIGAFSHALAESDITRTLLALQEARDASFHHLCTQSHCDTAVRGGVHIQNNILTRFEGSSYEDRLQTFDTIYPLEYATISPNPVEVDFTPNGHVGFDQMLTFSENETFWNIKIADGISRERIVISKP